MDRRSGTSLCCVVGTAVAGLRRETEAGKCFCSLYSWDTSSRITRSRTSVSTIGSCLTERARSRLLAVALMVCVSALRLLRSSWERNRHGFCSWNLDSGWEWLRTLELTLSQLSTTLLSLASLSPGFVNMETLRSVQTVDA